MKFKIFMSDYGYFNEARMAAALGLRRTTNGRGWSGWVEKKDLETLDRGGYRYRVLF